MKAFEGLTIHGAINGGYRRAWATRPTINEAGHAVFRCSLFWRIKAQAGRKVRVDLGLPGMPVLYAVLRRTVPGGWRG